jgi:hypothetical protein
MKTEESCLCCKNSVNYTVSAKRAMETATINKPNIGEISGSHGCDYEDGCLLGCCAM